MRRTLLAGLVMVLGCDPDPTPDAGRDGGVCVPPDPIARGELAGAGDPLGSDATEARAGRLTAAMLPADPTGLGTAREGDLVLANDRIAVIIEAEGSSDGFDPWGGKPVGLARVEGGALVEPADFGESIPMMGRFIPEVSSVGVLRDGSDGGPAVIRSVGVLRAIPAFDVLFSDLLTDDLDGIEVAVDYSLAPGEPRFTIDYTFRLPGDDGVRVRRPLLMFFQGNRMPGFVPGRGFDVDELVGDLPYVGYVGEGMTSYAVRSPAGPLSPVIELSGASLFATRAFVAPPCALHVERLAEVIVGGPGLHGLLDTVAAVDGVALRTVEGMVTEASGAPAEGVRVVASADGWLDRARTDVGGSYRLSVPAEGAAAVRAWHPATGAEGPIEARPGGATPPLALPARGAIAVQVTDLASASALPARVQVVAASPPEPPPELGEPRPHPGRFHVVFAADGAATMEVPVGTHRVVASRGYEWDLFTADVTVAAGETATVDAALTHAAPTVGALCGDFHIHTHRSIDAPDDARRKLAAAVAEGVEIPVRTDHEWVADFEPLVADMGLEAWAYSFAGIELTTFLWGHFGVFPLEVRPSEPNGGAFAWAGRTPPDVFGDVRARTGSAGSPALVINHPRTFGGLMNEGAYFDAAGYDAATGAVERPELWDESFELLEAFNASDFDDNLDETVADWFSFLAAGRRVFVLGASDSHRLRETPIGYPRTCADVGVDDAPALRALGAGAVRDALRAGHSVVHGGVAVEARARGGEGPGYTVSSASPTEAVDVVVRAPAWVDVDRLRVFVDGALRESIPIDETTADPMDAAVRLRASVEVPVDGGPLGSWVVLVASGDTPLAPVHPDALPFGVTNPIFFTR